MRLTYRSLLGSELPVLRLVLFRLLGHLRLERRLLLLQLLHLSLSLPHHPKPNLKPQEKQTQK